MAEEQSGFLGRWARRKTDALQGKPLDEPAAPVKAVPLAAAVSPAALKPDLAEIPAAAVPPAEPPEKLLSLDDVKALTQASDFKPFMARNVGADVRNAAMKKLFTDPHYNVMDGLDIYIGDYSIADPIPESMLRQMVGAKLLNIFDDQDEKDEKNNQGLENPVAAAEKEAALAASSLGDSVKAADGDTGATPVLPSDEISRPAIPPESGAVDRLALSTPHVAGHQENALAGAASAGPKGDQVAL